LKELEIAEKLYKEDVIGESSYQNIKTANSNRLFSIGIELRSILYIGILLLSTGLGILVYKNIDTIGHLAVLLFIALLSLGCYAYCYVKRMPYSNQKVPSPNILNDYILLLASLSFATFMGYLQYQYSAFGPHNEIAFLIPAIIFFTVAYYFDHIGILSMAITALAGFAGISISPIKLLESNDFSSDNIILTGLGLGILLVAIALILRKRNVKSHFTFTYFNFAIHLLFVSCLAGLFTFNAWFIFLLILALLVFVAGWYAFKERSFYFLLFTVLYAYIGISYVCIRGLVALDRSSDLIILTGPLYFIATSILMIVFLVRISKKFKPNDNI
jgi:hypothetical protein